MRTPPFRKTMDIKYTCSSSENILTGKEIIWFSDIFSYSFSTSKNFNLISLTNLSTLLYGTFFLTRNILQSQTNLPKPNKIEILNNEDRFLCLEYVKLLSLLSLWQNFQLRTTSVALRRHPLKTPPQITIYYEKRPFLTHIESVNPLKLNTKQKYFRNRCA